MLSLAIVILILGLISVTILQRHLREAKLLRLREISHEERMMAMEHELPIPEVDTSKIDALLCEGYGAAKGPGHVNISSVHWIRLVALALGLILLFGGVGAIPGIYLLSDPEASGTWPLGLVPIFIGTGFLIFFRLSRGLAGKMKGEEEAR